MKKLIVTLIALLFISPGVYASGAFPVNDSSKMVIGLNRSYTILDRETLIELARIYDIGFNEITAANSSIDPWIPKNGTKLVIPTSWLLPELMDEGIIINVAEMRLYYFFQAMDVRFVKTFPIGIGTEGFDTPVGIYNISAKVKDPIWHIPRSIRDEYPELPDDVPPGPDNPLGEYWLQLSDGYGIHGTNRPFGIGRRVSHGCIRLYPEDIRDLFKFVKKDTQVKIIDEPVKMGTNDDILFIEVHRSGRNDEELLEIAMEKLSRKPLKDKVNMKSLLQEIRNATGLPAVISN